MLTENLSTPAVLVDQQRLQRNLVRMQQMADANGVALRPHTKTHKSTAIARQQVAGGAQGITVAKVGEAEVFVAAGFDDVRLAYTIVGRDKHERLLRLMKQARITFCVDTIAGARAASDFYAAHDLEAEVLLEVDAGYGRCGVRWDAHESVKTAQQIAALPGLKLAGILTHAGQSYHGPQEGETTEAALRRASNDERDRMLAFAGRLHEAGITGHESEAYPDGTVPLEISIGSTPSMTYFENQTQRGFSITEIRPGNYVFYDAMQAALGSATLDDCALSVLTTVISRHRDGVGQERLFLDAGKKVLTSDVSSYTEGYGVILYNPADRVPHPHARLVGLSEEHGWVQVRGGSTYHIGDRVQVIPNHACVVVNTQEVLYLVEDDEVVEELTVDARGRVR